MKCHHRKCFSDGNKREKRTPQKQSCNKSRVIIVIFKTRVSVCERRHCIESKSRMEHISSYLETDRQTDQPNSKVNMQNIAAAAGGGVVIFNE